MVKGLNFLIFFAEDNPYPGLYRGIKISKEKGIQTGYSNDCVHVDDRFDKSVRQIKNYLIDETNLTEQDIDSASRKSIRALKAKMIDIGKGFNENPVPKPDKFVSGLYKFEYNLFMKTVGTIFIENKLKNILKENPNDTLVRKVYGSFNEYMYNILYDRGLFTGTMIRTYFNSLIERYMDKYHSENYKFHGEPKGQYVTFELFHLITDIDLRISGTNMTAGKNLIFSLDETPQFPVSEAVGISMNIPGVFKPIFIDNQVSNVPLSGLWVDGGLLNNLPFGAFDKIENGKVVNQIDESKILGFNIIEGLDPIIFEKYGKDPWLLKNNDYLKFIQNYIIKNKDFPDRKDPLEDGKIRTVKPSKLLGNSLFSVLGYLLGIWLEDATFSQISRSQERIIDVYSFHIGTLDFTPDSELLKFVVTEANKRTKERLGQEN